MDNEPSPSLEETVAGQEQSLEEPINVFLDIEQDLEDLHHLNTTEDRTGRVVDANVVDAADLPDEYLFETERG